MRFLINTLMALALVASLATNFIQHDSWMNERTAWQQAAAPILELRGFVPLNSDPRDVSNALNPCYVYDWRERGKLNFYPSGAYLVAHGAPDCIGGKLNGSVQIELIVNR